MGGPNSGGRQKPASIRALHGSRTRAHHRDEPVIPDTIDEAVHAAPTIPPPIGLTKAEQRYWAYFAPLLSGARVLTPADVETLADYCRACVAVDSRAKLLRQALRPPRVTDTEGKRHRGEIDLCLVRMLDAQMRGWIERKTKQAEQLGLTAISRTRVQWSGYAPGTGGSEKPKAAPKSKLAQLQEEAKTLRRPVAVK